MLRFFPAQQIQHRDDRLGQKNVSMDRFFVFQGQAQSSGNVRSDCHAVGVLSDHGQGIARFKGFAALVLVQAVP